MKVRFRVLHDQEVIPAGINMTIIWQTTGEGRPRYANRRRVTDFFVILISRPGKWRTGGGRDREILSTNSVIYLHAPLLQYTFHVWQSHTWGSTMSGGAASRRHGDELRRGRPRRSSASILRRPTPIPSTQLKKKEVEKFFWVTVAEFALSL